MSDTTPDPSDPASDAPRKRIYTPEHNAGRWTVRGVEKREITMAMRAAKRRKCGVGEWLSEAIRAHVATERKPAKGVEVLPPASSPGALVRHTLPPLSLDDIARAVEIAERIKAIQGRAPRRLLTMATRLLADRLAG